MSFNGIATYERNLRLLMDTPVFKTASDAKRLDLGYRLLKSPFGLGGAFGFGKVIPLPIPDKV